MEYETALSKIGKEFIPNLEDKIDDMASEYSDPKEDPSEYFDEFAANLTRLHDYFEDTDIIAALESADSLIDDAIVRLEDERAEEKKRKEQEEGESARKIDDEAFEALVDEYEHERTNRHTNMGGAKPGLPSQNHSAKLDVPRNVFDDVDK